MNLAGEFEVRRPRPAVFRFLTNPECFGRALPDLESLVVHGPSSFEAVIRVGISFIKGPLRVHFDLIEAHDGERARYVGKGSGIGSFVDVQAGFSLEEQADNQTKVTWEGIASIGGRVATVATGILMQVARKNVGAFVEALKNEIEKSA